MRSVTSSILGDSLFRDEEPPAPRPPAIGWGRRGGAGSHGREKSLPGCGIGRPTLVRISTDCPSPTGIDICLTVEPAIAYSRPVGPRPGPSSCVSPLSAPPRPLRASPVDAAAGSGCGSAIRRRYSAMSIRPLSSSSSGEAIGAADAPPPPPLAVLPFFLRPSMRPMS